MAIDKVKAYFDTFSIADRIIEFDVSSATVELAAAALNVAGQRIAKTLSFRKEDGCLLVVTAGDTKVDNAKFKQTFQMKARMLSPDDALRLIGHAVGGICPFAVNEGIDIYLDVSLRRFATVFPACGSSNSAIELTLEELELYAQTRQWVDVCALPTE